MKVCSVNLFTNVYLVVVVVVVVVGLNDVTNYYDKAHNTLCTVIMPKLQYKTP